MISTHVLFLALAALATGAAALTTPGAHAGLAARHAGLARRQAPKPKRCAAKGAASTSSKPASTAAPKPAAKPTPKPAPPKPKAPVSNSGPKKVGLAWTNGMDSQLHLWDTSRILGTYNWSPRCNPTAKQLGLECFPMLWGDKDTGVWKDLVKPGYARHALGCNEVNQPGQSQMSPQHGAQLWREYMAPLKQHGYTLGSHSTSNAASGQDWLDEYFKICPDCKSSTDLLTVHFYGTDADRFIDYITDMHTRYKLPVIVTEFACNTFSGGAQCDTGDVKAFLDKTTAFMDKQSWVYGYFYFGLWTSPPGGVTKANSLMLGSGAPNDLGMSYIH